MNLFYDFVSISNLDMFSFIDFTSFTSYEQLTTVILFNILFYLFLIFFCSVAYKTICRIISFIF